MSYRDEAIEMTDDFRRWPIASLLCKAALRSLSGRSGHQLAGRTDPERSSRCSVRLNESEMERMAGANAKRAARLNRAALSHLLRFANRE
jgi:hypothetical protein